MTTFFATAPLVGILFEILRIKTYRSVSLIYICCKVMDLMQYRDNKTKVDMAIMDIAKT